jgi:hypothetical protein
MLQPPDTWPIPSPLHLERNEYAYSRINVLVWLMFEGQKWHRDANFWREVLTAMT